LEKKTLVCIVLIKGDRKEKKTLKRRKNKKTVPSEIRMGQLTGCTGGLVPGSQIQMGLF
jgi:hypothetical protein